MNGRRRTFVASDDLLKRIGEKAKANGLSMYDSVNEILELALDASDKSINLRAAMEERNLLKAARERGFILGLENLWFEMAELGCSGNREKAEEIWHHAGVWFASQYSTEGKGEALRAFERDMKTFIWNMPEFELSQTEEGLSVRIINPRFSESYALLFAAFMEGALEAFGFTTVSREVAGGSVRLTAAKRSRKAVLVAESPVR